MKTLQINNDIPAAVAVFRGTLGSPITSFSLGINSNISYSRQRKGMEFTDFIAINLLHRNQAIQQKLL